MHAFAASHVRQMLQVSAVKYTLSIRELGMGLSRSSLLEPPLRRTRFASYLRRCRSGRRLKCSGAAMKRFAKYCWPRVVIHRCADVVLGPTRSLESQGVVLVVLRTGLWQVNVAVRNPTTMGLAS